MSGGLVGLLDDVAALAKLAAASIDDVGAAAGRAGSKTVGVVVDDTAVTPAYVQGLAAERELPIIKRIAKGSLKNKVLFILPAALLLSEFVPILVEIVLMVGGTYLCYEGAEKIHHRFFADRHDAEDLALPAAVMDAEQEDKTIAGAIRTDFILSGEIMVIALKEVIDEGFVSRAIILLIVAVLITALVYGVVALIVKMDDVGLRMVQSGRPSAERVGRALVTGMPKVLALLSVVGTAAMVWVGGHILLVGAAELGWHGPEDLVHSLEDPVHDLAAVGGVLGWLVNTTASAIVGLAVGFLVLAVVSRVPVGAHDDARRRALRPDPEMEHMQVISPGALADRVALVTGGGRGIGRSISEQLAAAGATVAVNYRRDAVAAAETVAAIEAAGGRARVYAASVDDADAMDTMVRSIRTDLGPVDLLVCNAGIASRGRTVVDTDPSELVRVLHTHAVGAHHACRLVLPSMRTRPCGDIVMISSVAATALTANGAPYNMGKAAVEALAMTLAKEELANGIHVNVVAPGLVETDMGIRLARAITGDAGMQDLRALDAVSPFGRACRPADVADAVVWLCTAGASYLTGQRIVVDGGAGSVRAR